MLPHPSGPSGCFCPLVPPELQPYENVHGDNYCVIETFLEKDAGRKWVVLPLTLHGTEGMGTTSCDVVSELLMLLRACSSLCPGFPCSPQVNVARLESHFPSPCLFWSPQKSQSTEEKSSWSEHLRLNGDGSSFLEAWSCTTRSRTMNHLMGYCFPPSFLLHLASDEASSTAQELLKAWDDLLVPPRICPGSSPVLCHSHLTSILVPSNVP